MSAERPGWAPASIDLDHPSAARIYDYLLGGACNFEHDREMARKLLEFIPDAERAARHNRAFLRRAVRYCVDQGIRQFLDLGSGIPTVGNVHEVAQEAAQDSRVLYVDNEPIAVAHSELILSGNDRADVLLADLLDTDFVLAAAARSDILDLNQPLAVLLVSVLHFIPDSAEPGTVISRYVQAMAPGSYLVLSHAGIDSPAGHIKELDTLYQRSRTPGFGRTRAEVGALFAGTELVEPGLVWTPEWHPESTEDVSDEPARSLVYAGVGRKR